MGVRGIFYIQFRFDLIQYNGQVLTDLAVPETECHDAFGCQKRRTPLIMLPAFRDVVLASINLDVQHPLRAEEIEYVGAETLLPPEFRPYQFTISQMTPEFSFRPC